MSYQVGRAQARQRRMSRKAKRGIVRDAGRLRLASTGTVAASLAVAKNGDVVETVNLRRDGALLARLRQRFTSPGLGEHVRAALGTDRLVELDPALGPVETQYVAPRSYLVARAVPDNSGIKRESAVNRLFRLAAKREFGVRSIYGPRAMYNDDGTGPVEIRLAVTPAGDGSDPLERELLAGGWRQKQTDTRVFVMRTSKMVRKYAVKFCERHAGEWFTLSAMSTADIDALWRAEWCELFEVVRPLPGTGTTQHALEFHRYQKPRAARTRKLVSHDKLAAGLYSAVGFPQGFASAGNKYVVHPHGCDYRRECGNRVVGPA